MEFKVKLNNMDYRYHVYQIVNLYHNFSDIKFTNEENYDIKIDIFDDIINIYDRHSCYNYKREENLEIKKWIKKSIFCYFKDFTHENLPWGSLVGIRPSKIALSLIKKGYNQKQIIDYFYNQYLTREDKAKLCINVANMEQEIVNKQQDSVSIYIGMPFCPTRCVYCSFTSNPIGKCKKLVEPYLEALYYEMNKISEYIKNKNLQIECVYFGGGTPTSIDDKQFHKTLENIHKYFLKNTNVKEFTVECGRPDTITKDKLLSMKQFDVTRISINPQTMNNETLKNIGRIHNSEDTEKVFNLARELGFDNINMDIIVGLPGEGIEHVRKTCERIKKLNPDNLTVHGMSVKRASIMHEKILNNKKFDIASQKDLNIMYDFTYELAKSLDMEPYYMYRQKNMVGNMENVGYAKKNKLGIYNIEMIEERQTIIALGADAVSKIIFLDENRIERSPNVKDVIEYTKRVHEMVCRKEEVLDTLY